jgi:hypothetical protein
MGGVGGPRADLVPRQLSESSMAVIAFNPRRLHPLHWLHRGGGGPDVGGRSSLHRPPPRHRSRCGGKRVAAGTPGRGEQGARGSDAGGN